MVTIEKMSTNSNNYDNSNDNNDTARQLQASVGIHVKTDTPCMDLYLTRGTAEADAMQLNYMQLRKPRNTY